jgi:hypothetical protein
MSADEAAEQLLRLTGMSESDRQMAFRLRVAREGLEGYRAWMDDRSDPPPRLPGKVIGDLVTVARWFLEDHAPEAVRPAGERCER